ncbi:MAG: hypothetical protein ACR2NN_00710 [Bryobacteraceae bacterium]
MNKDFNIIFEKMDEQTRVAAPDQQSGVVTFSGDGFIELDELAELRRIVVEITEPEPLSFTTA